MEGERQDDTASKVLDDNDLLIEILLRVGFPTTLVCAALVCKRWLLHASDPAFLSHFRKLHPPRLLGFYINTRIGPRFIPMLPQPPELSAIVTRTCFCPDTWQGATAHLMDCRNGRIFTRIRPALTLGVHSPLSIERGLATVPPFPRYQLPVGRSCIRPYLLSKEGDHLSYFYVVIQSSEGSTKLTARVYMLQDGAWCTHQTLVTDQPAFPLRDATALLVDNKIYIPAAPRYIMVLDLMVSSFSTISLPQGVQYFDRDAMLSRPDDASGVYLIQLKELQLRIWLHKSDNWLIVDTVCLREMFFNLRMPDCTVEDEQVEVLRIYQVGDNAEFVFCKMGRYVLYLDIKCKTLRKVYELSRQKYWGDITIHPFMMIWPPTFPALKCDPTRIAMSRSKISATASSWVESSYSVSDEGSIMEEQ